VNVEEARPVQISVMGEVRTTGAQSLEPHFGLLQVIAQAGGLSDFANESRIFVLRKVPEFRRIRFTYEALINNEGGAATFPLRTGDVIVVE
jgi:polysaccharide export outer membrane protein